MNECTIASWGKKKSTYEWSQVLEAVRFSTVHANSALIAQDKRDLNNARQTRRHERVAEDRVDHGADHEMLRMRRHSVSGHQDDNGRDEIALGSTVAIATEPHAQQTRAPPDNSHGSVLEVVVAPLLAPAVLGEGIHAAPSRDDERVEELLAPACAAQPELADEKEDCQTDSVSDESASHNEVRQALSHVVILAEAQRRDAAEEHLGPGNHGHDLAQDAVG